MPTPTSWVSELFGCGQEGLGSVEELQAGRFRPHVNPLEAAFRSSAASEGQKILITEMRRQFVEVGLESDRLIGSQIVGFGSG